MREKVVRIAELETKAFFADAVAASDGTCLVGDLAKMMRQNGVEVGQNRLFEWVREDGYLGKSGSNRNVPTQLSMEQGPFRIKETSPETDKSRHVLSRASGLLAGPWAAPASPVGEGNPLPGGA